ncbi:DUF4331 family protein [Sphingomonas sp.]|uniref:DUF4331 family protein n=1 Tax=Sphingomonas sp. TaxID=28214 RepID=UPI002DF0714B|nr:DUF4331 family protein [Sphingomonas sp.]
MLSGATILPLLAGCGGDGQSAAPRPAPVATVAPTPSPTITGTSFDVTPCLNQQVALGVSVTNLIIPDTIKMDLSKPNGFPNGRRLEDPVVDVTLAVLFLDLTKHPANLFASLPLNPPTNDVPFPSSFPYVAKAQGNPPLPPTNGSNYNFRTDPASAYVRVDRTGMPAVATALISPPQKNPYNDADPVDDVAGKFVPDMKATLTGLTNALADDFQRLNLNMCAKPVA